jgi:diguanylate cyclase (GGDEF)-like protein
MPVWWERWWARLLGLGLCGALVGSFVTLRTRSLQAEQLRLTEELDQRTSELRACEREQDDATLTDALTQVRNRRFLFAMIPSEVDRSVRACGPFATPAERRAGDLIFYFVELDQLKEVNERFGHEAGDRLLLEAVQRLKSVVRASDFLIRWSGSVFLVLTRATLRGQAYVLADRVMVAFGTEPFATGEASMTVSVSIGWAPFPWFTETPAEVGHEEVLCVADRALEAARDRGRNRAVGTLPLGPKKGVAAPGAQTDALPGVEDLELSLVMTEGPRPV